MRTEEEIKNKIEHFMKVIDNLEYAISQISYQSAARNKQIMKEDVYKLKQEICLLKWILEPTENKEK